MTIEIITTAEAWVFQRLSSYLPLTALVGNRIYPAYGPYGTGTPFVIHDFAGGEPVGPLGAYGPAAWSLRWEIAVWTTGQGRQALRGPMRQALAALVGPSLAGLRPERWVDPEGTAWHIATQYEVPLPMPMISGGGDRFADFSEGTWARIAHAVELSFQLG